jgi:hypothetical protein
LTSAKSACLRSAASKLSNCCSSFSINLLVSCPPPAF